MENALIARSAALAFICAGLYPAAASADTAPAWVQFADTGKPVLRAVVLNGATACPPATADGRPLVLAQRSAASTDFPAVCQASLPGTAKRVTVNGLTLAGPAAVTRGPQRILVIGDTGCRLKGEAVQDCNDPKGWQFPAIARSAAGQHPDVVIHVGDYYYRETPCPVGADGAVKPGCAGSPYGDKWPTWNAEFFAPAAQLLNTAPWIFVRGNHESCDRGAHGWFHLLDAAARPLACPATSAPYTVALGPQGPLIHVMDSTDTEDETAPADKVAMFAAQFDALGKALEQGHGWIVTHRPIWGVNPGIVSPRTGKDENLPVNVTEQTAARGRPLAGVDLILSGHVHIFAAESFGPQRPAQMILGNGGDVPTAPEADADERTFAVDGMNADAFVVRHYGYTVLDRRGTSWTATLYAPDNGLLAICDINGRALACRRPPKP